jgi:hypothetical protein
MSSINNDTASNFGFSIAGTENSSCYSEDSQPRICFDEYCTFPMGNMCNACRLDRAVRKKRASKTVRVQQAKDSVEEINVQKYITNYSGEVFLGGADDRDELEEEDEQQEDLDSDEGEGERKENYGSEEEEDYHYESDETVHHNELDKDDSPVLSAVVPKLFASHWETGSNPSSVSERTFPSTVVSSRLSVQSNLSTHLEPWISDLFDRTLEGQMEETIFVGGAEDDPSEVICPLCRNSVGDSKYQHLIHCQYAHDEQERMEALWMR